MNSPRSKLRGITSAPLHSANKVEEFISRHIPVASYREFRVKTMKRQAYGFRDLEFFKLKIMAIHETKYALVG